MLSAHFASNQVVTVALSGLVVCDEEVRFQSSCRVSPPPVSLFKLRSNDHYEQRTWLVASGVKAFLFGCDRVA